MDQTPDPTQSGSNRRRHRRQSFNNHDTPFGQVLDISESGACIFRKGDRPVEVGQFITLQVDSRPYPLLLQARVVRIQPVGLRRHEIGVEFVNLSDQNRLRLIQLMTQSSPEFSPRAWLAA
ncbi:MAG: PilZ domain-containing protein [Planctomycetota bacterium]